MSLIFFENIILISVVTSLFNILLLNYLDSYHVLHSYSIICQIDLLLDCIFQIYLELVCFFAVLVWLQTRCARIVAFLIIVSGTFILFNFILGCIQRFIYFCFFYYLNALSLEALTLQVYISLIIFNLLLIFSFV